MFPTTENWIQPQQNKNNTWWRYNRPLLHWITELHYFEFFVTSHVWMIAFQNTYLKNYCLQNSITRSDLVASISNICLQFGTSDYFLSFLIFCNLFYWHFCNLLQIESPGCQDSLDYLPLFLNATLPSSLVSRSQFLSSKPLSCSSRRILCVLSQMYFHR